MKRPAVLMPVGGIVTVDYEFDVSLESLQRYVGGTIECINLNAEAQRVVEALYNVRWKRPCIVCNDESLILGLAGNFRASVIYSIVCQGPAFVSGNALVTDVP